MTLKNLISPLRLGHSPFTLKHRIVMAPMTRIRANEDTFAPTPIMAEYYEQRASEGGLIITEATHISIEATPMWHIYPTVRQFGGQVPGIWTSEQMLKWRDVTKAVHLKGAVISCQLLHTGRIAQPDVALHPLGIDATELPPVSSSATPIPFSDDVNDQYAWDKPSVLPRPLRTEEIPRLLDDYAKAAENALNAGFDLIEIHAAHGYLIDQFLNDGVNKREDMYGGGINNRCRLLFELIEHLEKVAGAGNVAVRLSPTSMESDQRYFGVDDSDPVTLYSYAIEKLKNLAYLLLTEPRVGGLTDVKEQGLLNRIYRSIYDGTLIGAGGFTPESAEHAIHDGSYDAIAFGRAFISNPNLVDRIKQDDGKNLTPWVTKHFYGGRGRVGYVDYV